MALVEHDAPVKVLTATPMHKLLESTSLTCIPSDPPGAHELLSHSNRNPQRYENASIELQQRSQHVDC